MEFTVQVKVSKESLPQGVNGDGYHGFTNGNGNGNGNGHGLATALLRPPSKSRVGAQRDDVVSLAVRMRSRLTAEGVRILHDQGGSDPESVKVALMALSAVPVAYNRHSWAVLGDMQTVHGDAVSEHRGIGYFCADHFIDHVVCVGSLAVHVAAAAVQQGMAIDRVHMFRTAALALEFLKESVQPGDVLLVKGGPWMKTEDITNGMCALG